MSVSSVSAFCFKSFVAPIYELKKNRIFNELTFLCAHLELRALANEIQMIDLARTNTVFMGLGK